MFQNKDQVKPQGSIFLVILALVLTTHPSFSVLFLGSAPFIPMACTDEKETFVIYSYLLQRFCPTLQKKRFIQI